MKKLKIYLDTSVISHLDHPEVPERMADTQKLWERVRAGEYDVVISDVTVAEIMKCNETKRNTLFDYLGQIEYTTVEVESDDKVIDIANRFIDLGILRQKSFDDCRHIAAAIISGCDMIVSWNFKHIVNYKTIMGVKAVTALEGYDDLMICVPSVLVGGEESDT